MRPISACVVLVVTVCLPPLTQQTAIAQMAAVAGRPWSCFAAASATLGVTVVDPCGSASLRQPSIHLTHASTNRLAAPIVVPGTPGSLAASVSGRTVVLSWSAPAGDPPASYVLEAGSTSGRSDLVDTDLGSAALTLTATDVPPGSYFVRVRARNAGGTSSASNEVVVTVQSGGCVTPPGAPTGLTAAASGTTVTLTWQAPSGGCAATAYFIEAGSAAGMSNLAAFSTGSAATSYSASGVGDGTYYVRIRSSNSGGTSAASGEVQLTVSGAGCQSPTRSPLGPPRSLASTVDGTKVLFLWEAPTGPVQNPVPVLSYVLEGGSAPGLSNLILTDTGTSTTSLAITAAAGTYYVRLRARNACETSAQPSNEITLVVTGVSPDHISILIADLGANRLARVTDLAGSNWETGPTVSSQSFNNPWHISLDSRGRIYIADRDNNRIVRMDDLAGNGWTTFSGIGANTLVTPECVGSNSSIGCVTAVSVDSGGRIYITASGRIVRIDDMNGAGWTAFGTGGIAPSVPGSFNNPKTLAFDRQGRIYVADTDRHRIDRFDDMQGTGWTTFGSQGGGVGQFNRPEGVAIDSLGRIYITDNENGRIVRMDDMTGAGWVSFGSYGSISPGGGAPTSAAVGRFDEPHDIAVSDSMRIYILDTGNGRVVRVDDMTGAGWTAFGRRTGGLPGAAGIYEFIAPKGLRLATRP